MALSNELISQFAKLTAKPENTKTETTVYGTAKIENDTVFVKIDGSDRLTPVQTTVDVEDGERVIVSVKDHSATITGNTSPNGHAARTETVKNQGKKIDEFDIVVSYKVTTDDLSAVNATIENLKAISAKYEDMTAVTADIESLQAKFADLKYVNAEDVTAITAEIESIHAMFGEFTDISTEDLEAANAEIDNLQAHTANFTYVSTELLRAYKAIIEQLEVTKLDVDFANIDYANIDKATFQEFYAKSGMIQNVTMEDGTVTGYLIGVTIKGDLIEGGTIVADKLVIKGEDGLYYKLNTDGVTTETEQTEYNSLNGSVITAKSITAEKMSVSDLAAFRATIGGFKIAENGIYSGVKNSVDNSANGIYLGSDSQFAFGDKDNYIKYYKDENGNFKFAIAAESIFFGAGKDFTLDDKGLTVEGQSDESNAPIKTVVSNNGMTVHTTDRDGKEKEMLTANDKGVTATDLHAKTYMIVGMGSRFEDYNVSMDTQLDVSADGPGDVNFYSDTTEINKTYTFSAKVTMPISNSSTIIVQSYPNGISSEYDIQQNNKISFTFKKENNDTSKIALYAPVDITISAWPEKYNEVYISSEHFTLTESATYCARGNFVIGNTIICAFDESSNSIGTSYIIANNPSRLALPAGTYIMLTPINNTDSNVMLTNVDKLNVTDYKITERRTGCFWIGD